MYLHQDERKLIVPWYNLKVEEYSFHRRKELKKMDYCCICHGNYVVPFGKEWTFSRSDKYQKQNGIIKTNWFWGYCHECKMIQSVGGGSEDAHQKLYTNGYRSVDFRGETVEQSFNRIVASGQKENKYRCDWILEHYLPRSILDIGSGLGIFPYEMVRRDPRIHIQCFEPNKESALFINDNLHIPCQQSFYTPWVFKRTYDLVSLVHVLEHSHKPEELLAHIKMDLKGFLYIEVPDASEFDYLPPSSDDFNSTHKWFFDLAHLSMLLEKCGYKIISSHSVRNERNLTRLMVLAERYDAQCLQQKEN